MEPWGTAFGDTATGKYKLGCHSVQAISLEIEMGCSYGCKINEVLDELFGGKVRVTKQGHLPRHGTRKESSKSHEWQRLPTLLQLQDSNVRWWGKKNI